MYVSYDTEFVTVNVPQRPGRTDKQSEGMSPQAAPYSANTGARASPPARNRTQRQGGERGIGSRPQAGNAVLRKENVLRPKTTEKAEM